MTNIIQKLVVQRSISCDEFIGEMRKPGCSEPTALKIWQGDYETLDDYKGNDINLRNLKKVNPKFFCWNWVIDP